MTKEEKIRLLTDATLALLEKGDAPILIEISPVTACCLIGQIHLSLRHPQNTGESRHVAERFARSLCEQMDPTHGDIYRVLMDGFDPEHDVEIQDSSAVFTSQSDYPS